MGGAIRKEGRWFLVLSYSFQKSTPTELAWLSSRTLTALAEDPGMTSSTPMLA